jgi:hypothetical protein
VSGANERLLLVTGCGRSSTKYISFVLRRLGRDVPDERIGGDVSGWTLAGPTAGRLTASSALCASRRSSTRSGIHSTPSLQRRPSTPSRGVTSAPTWSVLRRNACSWVLRCWLAWNERVERIAMRRYRIEALPEGLAEFCERLGRHADPSALSRVATE